MDDVDFDKQTTAVEEKGGVRHQYQISKEGLAGITGKTPHSARHAMGRHIIEKTGNVAAVQRQLGHKNATYSMQYTRVTRDELNVVLDER